MTPKAFVKTYPALLEKHGSQRRVAEALKLPRSTMQNWLRRADQILYSEQAPAPAIANAAPAKGVKRFIFTAAQDETAVHEGFLANLEAYAIEMEAKIIIAGFTYNKRLFEEHRKTRRYYAPEVEPYLCNRQIEVGDKLVFCGEMNTLPTASAPLSGFESYTREKWGIFPHAKVQLLSVATMKNAPAKIIMTTGAVTRPNYVQMRAGIRAHFHHVIGAVLVEIDEEGDHFCRHLLAEEDGSFYDLTRRVEAGVVTDGHRLEAITWGDIHAEKIDPIVRQVCWGIDTRGNVDRAGTMIDALAPKYQFIHDVTDFAARNHHNIRDPHFMIQTMHQETASVEEGLNIAARFLAASRRDWCETVIVESNHDMAFLRWLKESDWRHDPVNAEFHLEAQLFLVRQIRAGASYVNMLKWAMLRHDPKLAELRFLREDEGFPICNGEIEMGMHGHRGANGSRGNVRQFAKMGPKTVTADSHSTAVFDGAYVAGTSCKMDMGYNIGLSSWSHSHVATYQNGKRTIITLSNGKFAA